MVEYPRRIDLIRRVEGKEAYGMTFTLLTTSEDKKMGKPKKVPYGLIQTRPLPMSSTSIGEISMMKM